ncbi:MAG: peptidylprolyl isomerase [Bacteroidetes bacterium]|nr:peptidylprolyl isomerase [Bacteroidota bacterium]
MFLAYGCNKKNKTVVAEVGPEKILMYEFENQFLKSIGNNQDSAKNTTIEQRKDFLDLMIKLRLKVLDATEKGYLDSPEIKKDLESYKKNYISAFLVDKKVVDPMIKDLYEKKKFEVRASHILINLPQTATPEDSIKAYEKANKVIERLKNGDNFAVVAAEMSDDPSAKQNGGDLYYFTGGMTVTEFEDAVFKLNVGDFTKKPVRTMFGLHVVKLTDKRKRSDGIRASHILIQDTKDSLGRVIDSTVALTKINEVYNKLKNGEDFGKLAAEYSQDPGTSPKGGDLGFFDRRRMVQPFDSAAFTLKVGEFSSPVKTPYGYHIIKVTEIKPYPSFDKYKETLKNEFKRSPMYKAEYDKFVEQCLKDVNLKPEPDGFKLIFSKVDSTKNIGSFNFDSLFTDTEKGTKIATYKDGFVTLGDILQFMQTNKDQYTFSANQQTFTKIINETAKNPILTLIATKEKIDKEEDYLDLLKEYTSGLLREKIDLEQISSKIKITDEDIQKYYDSHLQQYTYQENGVDKHRPLDEAKSEITNILRSEKFNETEKAYIETLKQKYPVKINTDALSKAFKD